MNLEKNNIFKTEPGKKKFIKVFTTSKNFCNIDVYKYETRIIVNWLQLS